jgi:hypothetical protein
MSRPAAIPSKACARIGVARRRPDPLARRQPGRDHAARHAQEQPARRLAGGGGLVGALDAVLDADAAANDVQVAIARRQLRALHGRGPTRDDGHLKGGAESRLRRDRRLIGYPKQARAK